MRRQLLKNSLLCLMVAFGILLTLNTAIFADDNTDINSRAVHITRRLQQQLSLSNDQSAQVQKILTVGMVNQVPPPAAKSPQDLQNYETQKKEQWQQVRGQIFSVLTPEQQQRFQQLQQDQNSVQGAPPHGYGQSDSQGQGSGGGRHHHRHGMSSGMWGQNSSSSQNNIQPQPPPSSLPAYSQPQQSVQEMDAAQPVQDMNAMCNPKTGKTFPSNFKYDPSTGDPLQPIQ